MSVIQGIALGIGFLMVVIGLLTVMALLHAEGQRDYEEMAREEVEP